ncbi:MAG: threonine ammonia-lyase [Helicobacteraceae bacterium]
MIDLACVKSARENIKNIVRHTECSLSTQLSRECGAQIYLKKENLQQTGAYKLRGAFNRIARLKDDEKKLGVIAASAGNHAQGVAFSAGHFGIKSLIVMPEATPILKINDTKDLGADVILHGENFDEANEYAINYAKKHKMTFIRPFEDDDVIAGQGTIALELLEDLGEVDTILLPVGGSGLISGCAIALKSINPKIRVIGVTASGAPAMKTSFLTKKPVNTTQVKTIADGIAVRDTSPKTLEYILKYVDDFVEVDDEEIANAILFLMEKEKLVVEGAGAVTVASLLHNKVKLFKNEKVACVLSGGNIDVTMLNLIIEKGLLKSQRKMKIKLKLIDKPGSLQHFTEVLTELNANIVQIGYDRTDKNLRFGDAFVLVALEKKGQAHQEEIRARLKEKNYEFLEE